MKALKWIGIALGGLLVLILLVGGVLYFIGGGKWDRTYVVPTADLTIPSNSAAIARGACLVRTNGCTDCHTENLGGQVMVDAPPFRVVAANLTRGEGASPAATPPKTSTAPSATASSPTGGPSSSCPQRRSTG